MKRILLFLMTIFVLAGCGKNAAPEETTVPETTVIQETETIPETTEAVTVPFEKEQAPLILAQRKIWEQEDFSEFQPWWYTFTDLDHNGRMEVFAAITQGTGIFTTGKLFELSEDGTLAEYTLREFLPEIITNRVTCYEDPNGQYHYAFEDITRNGYMENGMSLDWMTLHDGVLEVDSLAWRHTLYTNTEETTYGNSDGPISQIDFWNADSEAGAGMNRRTVTLAWSRAADIQDEHDIVNSFQVFSGFTGILRDEKTDISFYIEGMSETVPMTLFVGRDYSIYIPDEGWRYTSGEDHGLPADHWESEANEDVWMHVIHLENSNLKEARLWLVEHELDFQEDNLISMTRTASAGYLEGKNGDGSNFKKADLYMVNNNVYVVLYSYPQEAAEGFGARLINAARTFEPF